MKDELISSKTAKSAKEKGFDIPTEYFIYDHTGSFNNINRFTPPLDFNNNFSDRYSLPTQTLLQKWLREVHNLDIVINPMHYNNRTLKCYFFTIHDILKSDNDLLDWQEQYGKILEKSEQDIDGNHVNEELHDKYMFEDKFAFKKFEEALEEALYIALTNI